MKIGLKVFLSLLLSTLLAVVWWRLWMYQGFVGPPGVLESVFDSDGEGFYDLVFWEMLIIISAIILSLIMLFNIRRRQ